MSSQKAAWGVMAPSKASAEAARSWLSGALAARRGQDITATFNGLEIYLSGDPVVVKEVAEAFGQWLVTMGGELVPMLDGVGEA